MEKPRVRGIKPLIHAFFIRKFVIFLVLDFLKIFDKF